MRIEFEYQGKVYKTKETSVSKEESVDTLYENFAVMNRMRLELEDGSTIIIGDQALKSGVLRVIA